MSAILLIIIIIMTSTIVYGIGIEENLRSYILADFETGQILEEYNIDEIVETASISKLMSYLVIMDEISKGNISLEDIIIIDKDTTKIKGSSFNLKVGEKFTIKELLEASIVVSGNDSTYALAKHVAGTEENFVNMMNEKAKELGFKGSIFYNSTGLPIQEKDVQNKMTTKEIFLLTQHIIRKYPNVLETAKIKSIEVVSRNYFQRNTNPLLDEIKEVDGLKTGFTNKAGYCYVSTFNIKGRAKKTKDQRLIAIVMGSKDLDERNAMAKVLVEYGLNNYSHRIFLDESIPLKTLEFPKGDITEADVFAEKGFSKLIKNDDDINVNINIDEDLTLPIKKNAKVGKAIVEKDKEIIFETDILIKEDVNKAKWYVLVRRFFDRLIDIVRGLWDKGTGRASVPAITYNNKLLAEFYLLGIIFQAY